MKQIIDKFDNEYAFLSNFYHCPIVDDDGIEYTTNEHYFQAYKTTNMIDRRFIAAAPTPGEAKRLGRKIALRPDWEQVKDSVMLDGLRLKFSKPAMKKKLLETGDAELIEGNCWHDNTWGVCSCPRCPGTGQNRLGKYLMLVRSELRAEQEAK